MAVQMITSDGCGGIMRLRWLRNNYKLIIVIGLLVICGVQLFLAYKSSSLESNAPTSHQQPYDPSGADTADSRKRANRLFIDDDDDDVHSNSNQYSKGGEAAAVVAAAQAPVHQNHIDSERIQQPGAQHRTNLASGLQDLQPACEVRSKDAISAVHRAKTLECKQLIVRTACAIQNGHFYASHLPNSCPTGNYTRGRSLGCYRDEKKSRLLTGFYVNYKASNSPEKCIDMCLQSGFVYAGVQYGTECFCGHILPPIAAKLPDSSCRMLCPGDESAVCGGYYTVNVYETGITKFEAQVAELIPNVDEPKVRIVFLLTLNGRALRQVHRLIKALYSSRHYFYIHVDARQDYLYRELLPLETKLPNVRLTRERFATIWGGASLLQMLLSCMSQLLQLNWQWDYVINLSESDFPIKQLARLEEFLTANRGRNFVKSHGRETPRFVQKQGLDKTFVECDTHMWRVGDRELPKGLQVDGGSDWVALNREFIEYVIQGRQAGDALITGLLTIFRHTLLPAESFFHTALRNSPFCSTYVDNNLHFTNWKRKLGCKCQYKHVVDWCGCSPNDFRPDDWHRLEATDAKQLYFARKFEPIINQAVILQLEEWMFGEYRRETVNVQKYWQNVYHFEDPNTKAKPDDDALLTIATSLIRNAFEGQLKEAGINVAPLMDSVQILQITNLMEDDRYKGFLILFAVELGPRYGRKTFEMLAKGTQLIQTNKRSKTAQRLTLLEVSSAFDQKEQRALNYPKALGPHSEPTTVFQLRRPPKTETAASVNYNLTVLWIDPARNLAEVVDVHIDDTPNSIYFAKLSAKHPLMPGTWSAKLIHKKTSIAMCKFLIVPLAAQNGQILTDAKARTVNGGGTSTTYELDQAVERVWERYLSSADEQRIDLQLKAQQNAQRVGDDLEQWIDYLVKHFFLVHGFCVVAVDDLDSDQRNELIVDRNLDGLTAKFEVCLETSWSSLAPDPKSDIEAVVQQ